MYKKVLVPVDGSAASMRGLDEAIELAKATGATLHLVHVLGEHVVDVSYAPPGYFEQLSRSMREAGTKLLAAAEARVRQENVDCDSDLLDVSGAPAAAAILSQAERLSVDLIVMGTHGRRGLRRLALGSDAEMVLRSSRVPVLLVRDRPEVD